jgi:methionine synthase I (cobalamin-dependent)
MIVSRLLSLSLLPTASGDQRRERRVDQVARIVGGCCETGPAHIACLRAAPVALGHRILGPLEAVVR